MSSSIRAAWLLAAVVAGCRSASDYREQADSDVYRLVRERRATLGIGDGSFTIEPPKGSLRERLLAGEAAGLGDLTLVQCLEIAAENSRDYRSHEETLYLAALDLTLERWNFSVKEKGVLFASVGKSEPSPETASAGGDLTLSKVLGTGATIVGNIGLDLSRALTTHDTWDPISSIGLAITQPLLRGAGSLVTYEPLTQAERNLVYAVRTFERYRRTFAFDVASRYYAILERADEVRNQQANYDNLQKLSERNTALAQAGRLDDIQAGQARQDELRSLDTLLDVTERLESLKDQFKVFLGLPPQIELSYDAKELERLAAQDLAPIELDPNEAAEIALAARLDHRNFLDQLVDGERHVEVAADALRAGLNLTAAYNQPSEAGQPGRFNFSDASWSLGAVLDLPLDRMQERNTYREAIIAEEVSRRTVESSEDSIRSALRDDIRQTKSTLESWKIQQGAVELAARRIESTDLKLQAGRALTRDLLDAQQSLVDTKNAASVALVEYTLSRLALFRDLELLHVDESGIKTDVETLNAHLGSAEPPSPSPAVADQGTAATADAARGTEVAP
jgi:outer membrane protein TolC